MKEEARIESECVDYAESLGWMSRKLDVGFGGKGWVDRLFIGPCGECVFVEFKVAGESPKGKQEKTINSLRKLGHNVLIFTSVQSFKYIISVLNSDIREGMK